MGNYKEFYTVNGGVENTIVIERSKFICFLKSCEDEEEIKAFIESIKKMHSLATHNCYAYIADEKGLIQKFSDDGEPQGTAGMPMLEVLRNKNLYKTVAVVTRYFGGVKLGTGGLVRAYQGAVLDALSVAKIERQTYSVVGEIETDYNTLSKILKLTSKEGVKVLETIYDDGVKLKVAVWQELEEDFSKEIINLSNGKSIFNKIDSKYIAF